MHIWLLQMLHISLCLLPLECQADNLSDSLHPPLLLMGEEKKF